MGEELLASVQSSSCLSLPEANKAVLAQRQSEALVPSWSDAQSLVLERLKLGCGCEMFWQTASYPWAIDWQQGPINACLVFVLWMQWKQKRSVLVISAVSSPDL